MKLPYVYELKHDGEITINEQHVAVIKLIFESYLSGNSLGGISKFLSEKHIPSPTGNNTWTRAAIDKLLSNKKLIPIVGIEAYFGVQFEKDSRSNIDPDTSKRKAVRYCSQNVRSVLRFDMSMQ